MEMIYPPHTHLLKDKGAVDGTWQEWVLACTLIKEPPIGQKHSRFHILHPTRILDFYDRERFSAQAKNDLSHSPSLERYMMLK